MIQSLQTSFQDFPFFDLFSILFVGFLCRKLLSLANKCCCKKRQVERQGTTTRTAAWLTTCQTTSPTTSPTTSLNDKSDDKSNDKSGDKSDDMHHIQSRSNKGNHKRGGADEGCAASFVVAAEGCATSDEAVNIIKVVALKQYLS